MKKKAPRKCPMCKEYVNWKKVNKDSKGFSVSKSLLGGAILGPIGLAAGGLGKKYETYCCGKCGFTQEYRK